jgi:hypothetical protein
MTVDRQTQALLDLVEADRRQKCGAILAEAQGRRSAVLRQAQADARLLVRKAFAEERQRRDVRVDAARANLQTRRRLAEQQRAAALLVAGWKKLPEELLRRWRNPQLRLRWVAAVIAHARGSLPAMAWRVTHAPDWPETDRAVLRRELEAAHRGEYVFTADADIRAGLKVAASGIVDDGTLDGLLSDRADIGAQLLQLLEEDVSR